MLSRRLRPPPRGRPSPTDRVRCSVFVRPHPHRLGTHGLPQHSVQTRGSYLDSYADDGVTEGSCVSFCDLKGYSSAGIGYGRECYCGYKLPARRRPWSPTPTATCPCAGDSNQACGVGNRLTVVWNGVAPPVVNPGVGDFGYQGCYPDKVLQRTLSPTGILDGPASVTACIDACSQHGYAHAGVDYAHECFCDNTIGPGRARGLEAACDRPCDENRAELCGSANALNLHARVPK